MAVRIQFRRGTAAEWASANPTLATGELGYETDTTQFKIGDGSTSWNVLDYSSLSAAYVDEAIANVVGLAPETLDTLIELAAAIGDDPDFANTINNNISIAEANAESYTDSAITTYNQDTTNVHGITDTAELETQTGAQAKADAAQGNAQSYADSAVANLVDSAPGTLDTLNELAAALGDDPNFATTLANTLSTKLTFVADTGANFALQNTASVLNTIYINTAVPGYVQIGDGVNLIDDLPLIGSTYADTKIAEHNQEIANVHGISNTANLVYQSDLTSHTNSIANVHGITDTANLVYQSDLTSHTNLIANVHGITDTANLVYQSELSDLQTEVDNLGVNVAGKLDSATASSTYAPLSNPTFIESVTLPANTSIGTVSSVEISHLDGVTSEIQTQIDAKAPLANATFTGTVSLPSTTSIGDVSATEIGYLDGVTSGIQGQIDDKAPIANPSFTGNVVVSSSNGVVFADGTQTKQGVPSITVITPKTASYTLSELDERDTVIEISNTSATTLTVPLNSSVAYPIGTTIDIIQTNTGQVTIAGEAGVTVNATPGLKLRAQWSSVTLLKRGTDSWLAFGDLSA